MKIIYGDLVTGSSKMELTPSQLRRFIELDTYDSGEPTHDFDGMHDGILDSDFGEFDSNLIIEDALEQNPGTSTTAAELDKGTLSVSSYDNQDAAIETLLDKLLTGKSTGVVGEIWISLYNSFKMGSVYGDSYEHKSDDPIADSEFYYAPVDQDCFWSIRNGWSSPRGPCSAP